MWPRDVVLPQAPGRGHDGRERCAQVVRDGVQQRSPKLVRAPQDLGFRCFLVESLAFDGQSNLGCRG